MSTWFEADDFSALVGDPFEVVLPDGAVFALTLDEVAVRDAVGGAGPDGTQRRQFSLLFSGPATPVLEQATWTVRHAGLGETALFLVPIGPRDDRMRYEAAFA
ncbi:hypothetical protein GUY44_24715 [Pimelobacter simplex]|uniref:DUF6916 domain-containing protein n=1 Tax=Nocardioides simplex TaxID=2045 RepID=A0A0A1DRT9_NOCSI|nr:hypothetical protein [Pimelobacter simplex]AIY18090.1 hypothetical protein KR76_17345 [Pimelobacter simplex]MCG8153700.1 hypothetical protein [Pimelobacter simplex]GEB15657.1 hypothetical protein NSI01_39720 [Pimelobacter simplex]SFN08873.1 hypothetical protein SAMN05421671_5062 [Pimelobacter simplex]